MAPPKEFFENESQLLTRLAFDRVDVVIATLERACVDRAAMRQM